MNTSLKQADKSKTKMYQMPSQKPDISKNILQNVLQKHIHVTSLTENSPVKG